MGTPTDWFGLPISSSPVSRPITANMQNWEFLYQFYEALRIRGMTGCNRYFPQMSTVYAEGIISDLTNTSFIDTVVKAGALAFPPTAGWSCTAGSSEDGNDHDVCDSEGNCVGDLFADANLCLERDGSNECTCFAPRTYSVILGADLHLEPWKIKRVEIGSNGQYTIRFSDLGLTGDELTALNGTRYLILKSWGDAWYERTLTARPGCAWRGDYSVRKLSEVQGIDIETIGIPNGGSFTITIAPWGTTWSLAYNASAFDVASAISALSPELTAGIGATDEDLAYYCAPNLTYPTDIATIGGLTVFKIYQRLAGQTTGANVATAWTIIFPADLGDVAQSTVSSTVTATKPVSMNAVTWREGVYSRFEDNNGNRNDPFYPQWEPDKFLGYRIAVNSTVLGGYPRFGTITYSPDGSQNSGRNWFYVVMDAPYSPVDSGPYAIFQNQPPWWRFSWDSTGQDITSMDFSSWIWNGHATRCYWSKELDISAQAACIVPRSDLAWQDIDPTTQECTVESPRAVFDRDFRTDQCTPCLSWENVEDDDFANDYFYKSWRGLQSYVEGFSAGWIPPEGGQIVKQKYQGRKKIFGGFVPATFFYEAGINSYTTTLTVNTNADGSYKNCVVPSIVHGMADGCAVYWAVEYLDDIVGAGSFWCDNGNGTTPMELLHFDSNTGGMNAFDASAKGCWYGNPTLTGVDTFNLNGATVYISFGWSKAYPRMVKYLYDRQYFSPDEDGGLNAVAPDRANPGNWIVRNKSAKYAIYQNQYANDENDYHDPNPPHELMQVHAAGNMGMLIDSVETLPASGGLIRYMGDNWSNPSTQWKSDEVTQSIADFYVKGTFDGAWPNDPHYSGTITASGSGWLQDSSSSWFAFGEWGGYSNTATGGSSSTIEDNTVFPQYDTDGNLIAGDLRWNTATGRWNSFIVEVTSGPCNGAKAPITSTVNPTVSTPGIIGFTIPNFNWQYTVNKFIAANIEVNDTFTVTISGDVVGAFSFKATTANASDVANGLLAEIDGTDGIVAAVEGDYLALFATCGLNVSYVASTTDGGGHPTQSLTASIDTRAITFHIHEPSYMKNRWAGRTVTITHKTGATDTFNILYSDNNTLWFDSSYTPKIGDTFTINEHQPGWTYSRNSDGTWTKQIAVNGGNSVTPEIVRGYGRKMHGDYFTQSNYNEMQQAVRVLNTKKMGAGWGDYIEKSGEGGDCSGLTCGDSSCADCKSMVTDEFATDDPYQDVTDAFNTSTPTTGTGLAPFATGAVETDYVGGPEFYEFCLTIDNRKTKMVLQATTCVPASVEFYLFASDGTGTAWGSFGGLPDNATINCSAGTATYIDGEGGDNVTIQLGAVEGTTITNTSYSEVHSFEFNAAGTKTVDGANLQWGVYNAVATGSIDGTGVQETVTTDYIGALAPLSLKQLDPLATIVCGQETIIDYQQGWYADGPVAIVKFNFPAYV